MASELRSRLIFGPLLAAFFFACLTADLMTGRHYGILSLVAVAILLSGLELRSLSLQVGALIPVGPLLVGAELILLTYFATYDLSGGAALLPASWSQLPLPGLILSGAFIWMCLLHMTRKGFEDFTRYVGMGMLCLGYLGICASMLIPLACLGDLSPAADTVATRGTQLVILHVTVCKLGDIFAFAGGSLFGKHKLAPSISPGKTWEGFAAALLGAVGGSYLTAWILVRCGLPPAFAAWWQPLAWGLVLGPLGVIGDLVESCLKRDAGTKDSAQVVPGFGGFLDVFDAIILSAPVAYALALLFAL